MISVDIDEIAVNVTPPRLRSFEMQTLILTLLSSYRDTTSDFYQMYEKIRYETAFNGQAIYLEHILDDYFDPILRRIHIGDMSATPIYLFNLEEDNEPRYFFQTSEQPVYLNNQTEIGGQFIIYVPAGQITNYNLFNSIVNKYKLKGKSYKIVEE